jgi:hypothetical protein
VGTRRLRTKIVPIVEITVTTAEPQQGDEIDLLILVQTSNKAGKFLAIGILAMILGHVADTIVVARIGG